MGQSSLREEFLGGWTPTEVRVYTPSDYAPLQNLYVEKGLSDLEPARRAEMLAQLMGLTPTDHDVLMQEAKAKGPAVALGSLELIAITLHQRGELDLELTEE